MKVEGACHCGNIRYEAELDPGTVGICHCTDCQALTGSAYRVGARASAESFVLIGGTPTIYIKTADSGTKRAHAFCPVCGSPVYAAAPETPPHLFAPRRRAEAACGIAAGPAAMVRLGAAMGNGHHRDSSHRAEIAVECTPFCETHEPSSALLEDRLGRLTFVARQIFEDDDIAAVQRELGFDLGSKIFRFTGGSMIQDAVSPSWRSAARKVSVRHLPAGARATSLQPRGAQPRIDAILALAQVLSMKTRRLGSSRPSYFFRYSRRAILAATARW